MGCGKTLTAIAIMGAAYQKGAIKRVLIVAPASVVSVWPKELEETAGFHYWVAALTGSKQKRLKALTALEAAREDGLKVAVINYEATWRDGVYEALLGFDADLIVADESQRIKDHTAKSSKAMHDLGAKARYRLILSGTPVQNNAVDVFSQYKFLDSSVFGNSFYSFRGAYCKMGGFEKRQVIGYRDLDGLIGKVHSIAYRVTKAEALDLPEQTFETRSIPMEAAERRIYDDLKREGYAELTELGASITAATVLTKLLRLQQFTGGFLQPDDGSRPVFKFDGKLQALRDILTDYVLGEQKKIVIFCRFRAEIQKIAELLEELHIGYGCIYGDVKITDRGDVVKSFQEDPAVMACLAQIDSAGLGLTLTAADTCVYYSTTFNYGTYTQSLARIHRIGQRNRCTYIHLLAEHTIDQKILAALSAKEEIAHTIVDDWRKYFV